MGQRFLWIQWEWGFVTMACFAAFMGKWLRRSKVMTGAEWMIIRFGNGAPGQIARTSYAVLAVVIAVAFIGFAEYGCGRFLHVFIPTMPPDPTDGRSGFRGTLHVVVAQVDRAAGKFRIGWPRQPSAIRRPGISGECE